MSDSTVLVLANAIYMKADWADPFDAELTSSDPFQLSNGAEVEVETMHGTVEGSWGLVEGGQVVSLPYRGEELEMLLALREREGTTLVLVTHDVAIADRAERCIHLRGGRVERIETSVGNG